MSTQCEKIDYAFSLLGTKWNAFIIRLLIDKELRFKDLSEAIPKISGRVLTQRLKELSDAGLIIKCASNKNGAYSLTSKGRGLVKVIQSLEQWAIKYN